MQEKYRTYLKSRAWLKIKKAVLERDDNKCTKCGERKHLHVHHKTYIRIYQEALSDLATLCRCCHEKEHGIFKGGKRKKKSKKKYSRIGLSYKEPKKWKVIKQ